MFTGKGEIVQDNDIEQTSGDTSPGDVASVLHVLAPWIFYVLLAAAGIIGLFGASFAADSGGQDAGLFCFVLAIALIAWRIHIQTGGSADTNWRRLLVSTAEALFLNVAVLAVLSLGVLLCTAGAGGRLRADGLAFFVCCVVFIFLNIKNYFDQAEASRRAGSATSVERQLEQ